MTWRTRMRTRSRSSHALAVVGMAVLAVVVLAGCSGTAPSSAATQAAAASTAAGSGQPRYGDPYVGQDPNAPACKLLTQAEVEAALTQTLKTPVGTVTPRSECHYVNAAGFGLT